MNFKLIRTSAVITDDDDPNTTGPPRAEWISLPNEHPDQQSSTTGLAVALELFTAVPAIVAGTYSARLWVRNAGTGRWYAFQQLDAIGTDDLVVDFELRGVSTGLWVQILNVVGASATNYKLYFAEL